MAIESVGGTPPEADPAPKSAEDGGATSPMAIVALMLMDELVGEMLDEEEEEDELL